MKLFRMRTLGVFGLGFLAGSRAGPGPWEKARSTAGQLKDRVNGGTPGSPSPNGLDEGHYTKAG
jgi:hypothetical protein